MKWAKIRARHKRIVKEMFGETYCENPDCKDGTFVAPAHRLNIRHYRTHPEDLSDRNHVIMLCQKCHQSIESSREKTEALFSKLRNCYNNLSTFDKEEKGAPV